MMMMISMDRLACLSCPNHFCPAVAPAFADRPGLETQAVWLMQVGEHSSEPAAGREA